MYNAKQLRECGVYEPQAPLSALYEQDEDDLKSALEHSKLTEKYEQLRRQARGAEEPKTRTELVRKMRKLAEKAFVAQAR